MRGKQFGFIIEEAFESKASGTIPRYDLALEGRPPVALPMRMLPKIYGTGNDGRRLRYACCRRGRFLRNDVRGGQNRIKRDMPACHAETACMRARPRTA